MKEAGASGAGLITVGRVTAPQGIMGEVRVWPETDFPERFLERGRFYLDGPAPRWLQVEGARFHKGFILVKFAGCDDRDGAEALRGYRLQVPVEELPPLPPGEYYHHQIIGLEVVTTDGRVLGRVVEILSPGANDVYVVRSAAATGRAREWLIPASREAVAELDPAGGRMVVVPLSGLLDE